MKTNQQRLQRRVFAAKTAFALAAIVLFGCSHNAAAQGNTSPWPSSGNVGIGTTSPAAPLEVQQAASPTVPNLYLSQAAIPSKSVFQLIKPNGSVNTWSFFGHNVYYNTTLNQNVLMDSGKHGWAFYFNGDETDAFYIYTKPTTGGDYYPLVLKRDGRLKLSNGGFVPPGTNQLEVQVAFASYVGAVIKAAVSQSANLQEWQDSSGAKLSWVDNGGNLYVGTATSPRNINATGTITGGNIVIKYQDVAEWVPSTAKLPTGTVVVLDSTKSNQVVASTVSYDTRVAGVVSEQPGIALGEKGESKVLVATTGRVRVKVDATRGQIHIGDLLVTSDIPGLAMKSKPVNLGGVQIHRPGTLIGKALEPLEKGSGEILVLLSLQ